MRKYKDLAILKTNKPNSKKVILDFVKSFGYQDYHTEELESKRSIGITFVSSDLEYEVENYSMTYLKGQENYGKDKFTLEFVKVDRQGKQHSIRKMEFLAGEKILDEKNETVIKLIEKEEAYNKNRNNNKKQSQNKSQKNSSQKNSSQNRQQKPYHKKANSSQNSNKPRNNNQKPGKESEKRRIQMKK